MAFEFIGAGVSSSAQGWTKTHRYEQVSVWGPRKNSGWNDTSVRMAHGVAYLHHARSSGEHLHPVFILFLVTKVYPSENQRPI